MSMQWLPKGFHTVTPNIIVDDAEQAVAFLKKALGATENYRLTMSDGKIAHCELKIGDSILNLGTSMEAWPAHGLVAHRQHARADAELACDLGLGVGQSRSFREHPPGSTNFTVRQILFSGLENQLHCTAQLAAMCGQDFGDSHHDGNVAVMPAGMHHAHILAAPVCTRRRRKR